MLQRLLLHWVISAIAVWLVAQFVPGFIVTGATAALIAPLVIGFVNGTLGLFIKLLTLPFTIMTLGLFWLVINGVMMMVAAEFIPGFAVMGFAAAFWGGIALSIVNTLLKVVLLPD